MRLRLLSVGLLLFAVTSFASEPPCKLSQRLEALAPVREIDGLKPAVEEFFRGVIENPKSPQAYVALYRNRSLVPENGTVHIVGPYMNHGEWVVPLLTRSDIRVIIDERVFATHADRKRSIEANELAMGWSNNMNHPIQTPGRLEKVFAYIKDSPYSALVDGMTFDSFQSMVKDRVLVNPDVRNTVFHVGDPGAIHPFRNDTPVPQADFLVGLFPIGDGGRFMMNHLKPGGVAWIVSENISSRVKFGPKDERTQINNAILEGMIPRYEESHEGLISHVYSPGLAGRQEGHFLVYRPR